MFLSWWNHTERKEKFIQILVFFLIFGASLDLKGPLFGTPMSLAGLYIIYDCIKRRSLAGFYLPTRYWLPLAVLMGTVVLASLVLGDRPSIHVAFQNLYRCLPFIVVTYLGKQADIKYTALLGAMASVLVSSADLLYLTQYLGIKGRVGAFGKNANNYATLLLGVLPFVFAAFQDGSIRAQKKVYFLQSIVAVLGLWSLWKTGSRGGMIGFLAGGFFVFGVICFYRKRFKQFLTGFTICFAVAAFVLLAGIPGGTIRDYDVTRLRMLRSSYAIWQDHKLAGIGLANWQKEWTNYLLKEEAEALTQEYDMPHNVVAWFFSTTGSIGGAGYVFFVCCYIWVFCKEMKRSDITWIDAVGFWVFLAITIHGMVDAGIIYKQFARLLYLVMGLSVSYYYLADRQRISEEGEGSTRSGQD